MESYYVELLARARSHGTCPSDEVASPARSIVAQTVASNLSSGIFVAVEVVSYPVLSGTVYDLTYPITSTEDRLGSRVPGVAPEQTM